MIWKKSKDKASQSLQDSPQVALWDSLTKDILELYASTRDHLVRQDKADFDQPFLSARRATAINDLQKALIRIREAFQESRKKEMVAHQHYAQGLRGLIWASVDQICSVMEGSSNHQRSIRRAKENLQKALNQNDLEIARKTIREVLGALSEMDKDRQFTIRSLQMNFQNHVGILQSELRMMQRELQLDGLTQIFNRATFDEQFRKTAQLCYLTTNHASIVMLDIDHFKKVNDSYGHPTGDAVIQACARTIVQAFPRKDDFVARYGGEEFVVILSGVKALEAQAQVEHLLGKIRQLTVAVGLKTISFTMSAGIAEYQPGESPAQWLTRADKALYNAKEGGRNKAVLAHHAESKAS